MFNPVICNSPTFFLVGISIEDTILIKNALSIFDVNSIIVLNSMQDAIGLYDSLINSYYAFIIVDVEEPELKSFVKKIRCNKDYYMLRIFGIRDLRKFDLGRSIENAGADFVIEKYDDWACFLSLQYRMWLKATTEERIRLTKTQLIFRTLCMN